AGQASDGPEGRKLLNQWAAEKPESLRSLIMDRAYEGAETRQLVLDLQIDPVVPPKVNRLTKWEYDRELYKKRNEVERLFRRLKAFRRIFSRFEKLDLMFTAFIHIALIFDSLNYLNTPVRTGTVRDQCGPATPCGPPALPSGIRLISDTTCRWRFAARPRIRCWLRSDGRVLALPEPQSNPFFPQ